MARWSLFFSEEHAHENDAQIRQYLEQNKLVPKRVFRVLKDGERFQVMHYGQCYLGQHLDNLCYAAEADPVEVGAEDRITARQGDDVPRLTE